MSASTEILIENIAKLEKQISDAEQFGDIEVASALKIQLSEERKKLAVCAAALNEAKQILKG